MNLTTKQLKTIGKIIGAIILIGSAIVVTAYFDSTNKTIHKQAKAGRITRQTSTDIEVVDWTNRLSKSGSYYHVEGIVKNTGTRTAYKVKIIVAAMDVNDKLVALEPGIWVEPSTLRPMQEGTFAVMMDFNRRIDTFSLRATWQ